MSIADIKSVGQREGENINDAITRAIKEDNDERRRVASDEAAEWLATFAPCEALRSRDPGAS